MGREFDGEVIELRAANPEGDLACDFTLATDMARAGIREGLAAGIMGQPRPIESGVEVEFRPAAWDAVRRYVELESRCCSFLNLHASQQDGRVLLRVTGRPDAQEFIRNVFVP